jgi:hypothetical protein
MKSRALKSVRRARSAVVATVLVAALAAVGIALAASPVAEPQIVSHPADPTNQTSASFTYSDTQSGVSFECQLDAAGYAKCPASGISYSGLAAGNHTFKVQAISGTKSSAAAVYKWTIDTTPPNVALAFPQNKHTYREESWGGCPGAPGLCGSAKDARGITSVMVSIQQGNGNWWGGSSFNKPTEFFNGATLASPGASSTEWSYPLPLPEDGSYTVHVRATDALGNTLAAESQLVTTFKIDSTPPPPTLTSTPAAQTTATTATFSFTDEEAGVTFLCKLDSAGSFTSCKSPISYSGLATGSHTFSVEAKDKKRTNLSTVTSYTWTVGKKVVEEQPFTISANVSGALAPGISRQLPLTISNPNGVPIVVTNLVVTTQAGSSKAGCDGPTNLQLTQSNVSATNTFTVPANGQVTVPTGSVSAPQVLMKNLATNQDACKGASFTFTYSGSAHS